MKPLLITTAIFFSTIPLFGAQVTALSQGRTSIKTSHETGRNWVVADRVCVFKNKTEVICGSVVKTSAQDAIVKLDNLSDDVAIGDKVSKAKLGRRPTAVTTKTVNNNFRASTFDITAGLGAGLSVFYPMLHLQIGIGKHFALGLQPYFYKAGGEGMSLSALGGMLTANYYGLNYFSGLWFSLGAGLTSLSAVDSVELTTEKKNSITGVATVGYRQRWANGWNAGIAGGAQFISEPNFTTVTLKSFGLQPILLLDFGVSF